MKAYVRIKHTGEFFNQNCYDVYTGCESLGIPVETYKVAYSIEENEPGDLVVGSMDDVEIMLDRLEVHPAPIDYPEALADFLGRKIWKSTLFTITSHEDCWHVFVKPVWDVKRFSGTVLEECKDLIKLGGGLEDIEVWCSEKVNFLSEWRLWVLHGEIIGLTPYAGRWDLFPDTETLRRAVAAYRDAPAAYALDFGVTDRGETLLVEASDGYALRSFGLAPEKYTKFLFARWQELTKNCVREAISNA